MVQKRTGGRGSRNVKYVIGESKTIDADDARKEAKRLISMIEHGTDVYTEKKLEQRRNEVEQTTLKDIFDDYITKRELRPTTRKLYDSLIRTCLPELFQMPIMDISKNMIEKKLQTLANEPGTRGDRSAQAAQSFRLLRALLRFASEEYEVNGKPIVSSI